MSENTLSTPSIYILPNEVLRIIVSYVPDTHNTFKDANGTTKNLFISPFFALMSVSHLFRMIALEDDRWLDKDFTFDRLVTSRRSLPADWLHKVKAIQALLADEHLRQSLSRKTHWTITDFDIFTLLVINLPQFLRTMRAVTVDVDDRTADMVDRLSLFPRLIELHLVTPIYAVDLEAIHRACPILESLYLDRIEMYETPLHNLASLRELQIDCIFELSFSDGLIPHGSAATLTSLSLIRFTGIAPDVLEGPGLSQFRNLAHLEIRPMDSRFWDIMPAIPSHLLTFKILVEGSEKSLKQIIEKLFTADCFRRLRDLHLTFQDDIRWQTLAQSYCKAIVKGIGSNLLMLTHLELGMCVFPSWCKMLQRLTRLKQLTLILDNEDLACMESDEGFGEGECALTSDRSGGIFSRTVPHIRKILASAFESVQLRPTIYIEAKSSNGLVN